MPPAACLRLDPWSHVSLHHAARWDSGGRATRPLLLAVERVTCTDRRVEASDAPELARSTRAPSPLLRAPWQLASASWALLVYALAEEGRSELLLSADEVSKRIVLWERSEFDALLQRCEQQKLLNQKHWKRKRQPQRDDAAGGRECARAGAQRKATSGLVSSMMKMTDAEGRQPAGKLSPNSNLNTGIHVPPNHESEVHGPGTGLDLHLRRAAVRGSHSSCPTGTRAEQTTDLLNVSRRNHANKVRGALASVLLGISRGALPPSARWLTRTLAHSHVSLLATQAEWHPRDPRKCESSCGRATPSSRSVPCKTVSDLSPLDMHQWGTNLPGACEALGALEGHPGTLHCRRHPGADGGSRSSLSEHVRQH